MDRKPVLLFIFVSIIILFSGTVLANTYYLPSSSLHEVNETNGWSERTVPYSGWLESPNKTISLLSKLNEESLTNCTNPESPIYDPNVLKACGKVPVIKNTTQLAEFNSTLQTVRDSSIREVKPYLYPNGPIVDYGAGSMHGYFLIKLYDYEGNKTVYSETELKEIYRIVEKYAFEAGTDEVPVIFCLWDKTAIFYFPENNSSFDGNMFGKDVVQLTNIEFPVFYYNIASPSSLQIIKNDSLDEIKPYLRPRGPIVEYGSDTMEGIFPIKLYYEENKTVYSQTELDEIYNIVRKYANKAGFDSVSVMFYNQKDVVRFESYSNKKYFSPNNSTSGDKNIVEFNNSNTNDSKFLNENISNLNSSSGNKSSKNSSTPGFGLLGGLACLFGGWELRKK
jgi:hypothetical protein